MRELPRGVIDQSDLVLLVLNWCCWCCPGAAGAEDLDSELAPLLGDEN